MSFPRRSSVIVWGLVAANGLSACAEEEPEQASSPVETGAPTDAAAPVTTPTTPTSSAPAAGPEATGSVGPGPTATAAPTPSATQPAPSDSGPVGPTGGAGGSDPVGQTPNGGAGGTGGTGGTGDGASGAGGAGGAEGQGAAGSAGEGPTGAGGAAEMPEVDLRTFAEGFDGLFIHDACTAPNPSQPDTCVHELRHEESFSFGGDPEVTYDVRLRVRGLFEPTTVMGGQVPDPALPNFKAGGTVTSLDYSHWHIEISEPAQTYWLNHYPQTSHTIYRHDFEVTLPITGGAAVVVRVIDGNDRQIDNGASGLADRQQVIEGVTDGVLDGQVLRLDVVEVEAR